LSKPKVTIGIPTLDRPEHLQFAIDSALQQTIPVQIIVADQGQSYETAAVMERYREHPNVVHLPSDATCLQENWNFAARACDTEYFVFLQDDDTLSRAWAKRVAKGLDFFGEALHIQGFCYVTPDRIHSIKWGFNGPCVGVNMRDLTPELWHGEYVIAPMYLMSWALSPGVGFRCGEAFSAALDAMPMDCDLFTERLIIAEMGSRGDWVADPITAGFWHHHGKNESYGQNANGSVPQQYQTLVDRLDAILDRTPSWPTGMQAWCGMRNVFEVMGWLKEVSKEGSRHPIALSRHHEAICEAMASSLEGRVRGVESPAPVEDEGVLVFD
jgi:glycosyltransferase involved in cell wall biosynthesis